jgi:hypothetical protein
MQQGRVTLEADFNEEVAICGEELRKETRDIVGPVGTPDNGYRVIASNSGIPYDFSLSAGTLYLGGLRLSLYQPVQYAKQSDWVDTPHNWKPNGGNFVYLFVREQEVSAVEDSALREVALGGPDTAQRSRLLQRIVQLAGEGDTCAAGRALAEKSWADEGLAFHPATMRLLPQARLQASFPAAPQPDPCEPEIAGGYLGADNQLIRIQIVDQNTLVWGFDDASFLYRVTMDPALTTLTLQAQPVDAFHQPQANQAVEVLRSAALLSNGEYVASATGVVQTLTAAYDAVTRQIGLPAPLPAEYGVAAETPRAFLRVWQQTLPFARGTPVRLGATGLFVTLDTTVKGAPFHVGDYWMIAVRPGTPTQVYPQRYLDAPQPPDGPRMWACPLAAIAWSGRGIAVVNVLEACVPPFDDLVELTKRKGNGCCTVSVSPADLTGTTTLQTILDRYANRDAVSICLQPGTYTLKQPLVLGPQHSNFVIEACPGAAILQAADSSAAFAQGLITLASARNVTFRGLRFELPLALSLIAKTAGYGYSFGIHCLDCTGLAIESCAFDFAHSQADFTLLLVVAAAIFAHGDGTGLRLVNNRFTGAVNSDGFPLAFQTGLALVPITQQGSSSTTAKVVGVVLDDALLRDNFFQSLTYATWCFPSELRLVKIESNTLRDCVGGFEFYSLALLGFANVAGQVAVAPERAAGAVPLHNALFMTLADPRVLTAAAALRSAPLPTNFDLANAPTVRLGRRAVDLSGFQNLFELGPAAAAQAATPAPRAGRAAARAPVIVAEQTGALTAHPFSSVQPVSAEVASVNATFSQFELAFAATLVPTIPMSLHWLDNDVNTRTGMTGSGLHCVLSNSKPTGRDSITVTGNTFVGQIPGNLHDYVAFVAGAARVSVTGNVILNEALRDPNNPPDPNSLYVAATQGAITGCDLLGKASLNVPPPPAPVGSWYVLNSITSI